MAVYAHGKYPRNAQLAKLAMANRYRKLLFLHESTVYALSWSVDFNRGSGNSANIPSPEVPSGSYSFKAVFTTMTVTWGDGTTTTYSGDGVTPQVIEHDYPMSKPFPLVITGAVTRIEAGATQDDKDKVATLYSLNLPGYTGNGGSDATTAWESGREDQGEFAGCTHLKVGEYCKLSNSITALTGTFKGCELADTALNIQWPNKLKSLHYTFADGYVARLKPLPRTVRHLDNVFTRGALSSLWPLKAGTTTFTPREIRLGVLEGDLITCESSDLDEQFLWELTAGAMTANQPNLSGYRALTGSAADPFQESERLRIMEQCLAEQKRCAAEAIQKYLLSVTPPLPPPATPPPSTSPSPNPNPTPGGVMVIPGIPVDGQPIEDPVVEPPVGISPPPPIPPWVSQPPHVFLDPPTTPRFKVPIPGPVAELFTVKHEDDPGYLMPSPGVLYNDGLPYINGRTTYATPDPTWTDVPDSLWRAWATRLALAVNDALNVNSTTEIPAIFAPVYFRYLADRSRDEVSISSPDKGLLFCPSGSGSGLELYNIYGVEVASNPPKNLDAADYDGEFIWVDAHELEGGMALFSGGLTAADPSPDDLAMVQVHRTPRRPKELMSFRVAWEGDMPDAEPVENAGWEGIKRAVEIRNRIISAIGEDPIFSGALAGTAYVLQHPLEGAEGETSPIGTTYTGFAAGGAADTSIGVTGAVVVLTGATGATTNEVYWRFCPDPDTAFGSILQIDGGELLPIPLFNEPAETPELEAFRIRGTRQALIVGVAGAPFHVFDTWQLGHAEALEQANAAFALPPLTYPDHHWGMMHEGYGVPDLPVYLSPDMSARIPLSEAYLETSPPVMVFRDRTTGEVVVDPASYQEGTWHVTRSYYHGVIFNAHYIPIECAMVKLCDSEEWLMPQSELSTEIAVATAYVQERWPPY